MSIIQFPTALAVSKQTWIQQRNDVEFRSMFGAQAIEGSAPLWSATIYTPTDWTIYAGPWQSIMMQLRGRQNQLALWNFGRPVPLGTMRGSMTLGTTAQGASVLDISAGSGQAATTLKQGDFLGVGSGVTQQVVMVLFDAVADGSGTISVTVEPPLNNAFTSGSVVTWNMPCALFRRKSSTIQWDHEPLLTGSMMLDLLEDVRP